MATPPSSFDEDAMADWSVWVLDHGLPTLPTTVRRGDSVPVARWVGPRFAAVLHLQWMWSDDPAENNNDAYLATDIDLFRRTPHGWEVSVGGGGSNWPFDPPLVRPLFDADRVVIGGEVGSGGEGWYCCALDGLAGVNAVDVEVADADGVTRRAIDSPLGIILVAVDGTQPATISVLDATGAVLATRNFKGDPAAV